jgi:UDP-glucose 4-epimerase
MAHTKPSALLTGGAGFLGTHLARAWLEHPAFADSSLVILDDLSGGFSANVPGDPRVTFVQGSVTDAALVDDLFAQNQFRFVYHLAAYAAEGLSHFIRRFNYTNNLLGSMTLINASIRHEVECFVFTSSIAVYGSGQVPMSEETTPLPEDPYGIAKYAVELDLQAAHDHFGLDFVTFRPHNVYGEHQNIGDRYRNVVGIFMNQLLQGRPMSIFGDGLQQRAFTYVGDIAPSLAAAPLVAAARNRVFNVGEDQPVTVGELAGTVADVMGCECRIEHLPPRQEVEVAFADHSRWQDVFGPVEFTPLQAGLERMARWVRNEGARHTPPFTDIEIARGLPESWQR